MNRYIIVWEDDSNNISQIYMEGNTAEEAIHKADIKKDKIVDVAKCLKKYSKE